MEWRLDSSSARQLLLSFDDTEMTSWVEVEMGTGAMTGRGVADCSCVMEIAAAAAA
jgi:hypothetical protein